MKSVNQLRYEQIIALNCLCPKYLDEAGDGKLVRQRQCTMSGALRCNESVRALRAAGLWDWYRGAKKESA